VVLILVALGAWWWGNSPVHHHEDFDGPSGGTSLVKAMSRYLSNGGGAESLGLRKVAGRASKPAAAPAAQESPGRKFAEWSPRIQKALARAGADEKGDGRDPLTWWLILYRVGTDPDVKQGPSRATTLDLLWAPGGETTARDTVDRLRKVLQVGEDAQVSEAARAFISESLTRAGPDHPSRADLEELAREEVAVLGRLAGEGVGGPFAEAVAIGQALTRSGGPAAGQALLDRLAQEGVPEETRSALAREIEVTPASAVAGAQHSDGGDADGDGINMPELSDH
jgi:hypothetical protein